ncbi:MAG TPA: putative molybdenum carrier protein [Lacipirellulaceae bacterium]|nr:putative molybdenum carrier protein [Lacipirellulaceae bacterium]
MPDLRQITIVSGGQTGADRAALDFAIEHDIPHAGWCPRGRPAEDGIIPALYRLAETPLRKYSQRTEWNVRDTDATAVFSISPNPAGGTALTLAVARRLEKPWLHLCRDTASIAESAARLIEFLDEHRVRRLNIAGPRASQEPGVAAFVRDVLQTALANSSPKR